MIKKLLTSIVLFYSIVSIKAQQVDTIIGPIGSQHFGHSITILPNGNYTVVDTLYNDGSIIAVGAVHLYNGANHSLISTLKGSNANDYVGNGGIIVLSNGNYVVCSKNWNGKRGAVTWGNGSTGISGIVSSSNSLIGSIVGDYVGNDGIIVLSNGNYVVSSKNWNGDRGAATWGNGSIGISGAVSSSNSLIGSNAGDRIGEVINTLNNGNYVVSSSTWNGNRGAATWGNGSIGISGTVNSSNSLVGFSANEYISNSGIYVLNNGNYIVGSKSWSGSRGSATWGNGSTGISGFVNSSNSLVGTNANDRIGEVINPLKNGNYVVSSKNWNGNRGAATWGNGSTGISGTVSSSNSLVGSIAGDFVGIDGITALSNGNYVVSSKFWSGRRGAATWGNGSTGISGTVSSSNSLVGSLTGDRVGDRVGYSGITALSNGNYVVISANWNGTQGAVTWGNGSTGISGTVSSSNSLVGSNTNDYVGYNGITELKNGNYVVRSTTWNNQLGAATWGNGSTGISGTVSSSNSLVGNTTYAEVSSAGITVLNNGNYVVGSLNWSGSRGAATWGNGSTGISGIVSSSNSLVGSNAGDRIGEVINPLNNGNYVVSSTYWNNLRGSATWGNGSTGVSGIVSSSNSLVSNSNNEKAGLVTVLSNGNYVVSSNDWNGSRGAATWGNGSIGISGFVSSSNSLVGADLNDNVSYSGITVLKNGNYVVVSGRWNNRRGAVSISCKANPIIGTLSNSNSLVGNNISATNIQFSIVENTIYNYVLISRKDENKIYIYNCIDVKINVKGNNISILNGDTTPSLIDSTDMGITNSNLSRRFKIINSGTDTLKIKNIISSGTHSSNFIISNIPSKVIAGDSNMFTVTFAPSSLGIKNATIKIFSNDFNQDTFQFNVSCERLLNAEINVKGNDINISNGDTTPSLADSTNMGNTTSNLIRRFKIVNNGTDTLNISSIECIGLNATDFVVNDVPSNISSGNTSFFTVKFSPSTVGIKNGTIKILSNDIVNDTFLFDIKGEKIQNTSTNNIDKSNKISIYPNPLSTNLNITIESILEGETAEILMTDALGKVSYKKTIFYGNNLIDLSPLSSGLYGLKIITKNNTYHFKIIKNEK
jgi:hypothetical protein